uniref:Uncharacterized protein n=1 Tax=Ascaris lumbricoides TaxID=6252 RepID=A0A0M3HXK7_ASCLU
MFQFTFATEKDFVFRRFTLLKVQVGILAVFCIFLQTLIFLSQLHYLLSSMNSSNSQKGFLIVPIIFAVLFIIVSPFASYALALYSVQSSGPLEDFGPVRELGLIKQSCPIQEFGPIHDLDAIPERIRRVGIEWLTIAPVYIFSTVVAIFTLQLANAWREYCVFSRREKQIEENYLQIWNQQGQMIYIRSLR